MVSSSNTSAVEPGSVNVKNLPDYSALKQLAAALWQQNNTYHGAAVMIGAGFSRCAASTNNLEKKLPLWNDLSLILAKDLGSSSSSDPLRLAEEYCAYFGKQALHDLVTREINDAAWVPGELYQSLLKLPWSEMLTTNWDTLLERASLDVHQPVYNLVSRQEDLSSARSPRIVKLHGTVNVTEYLIFTQEDYRKYPQKHAAFVNFGRQVFIENELCLLGFSGDDPNFLQWAGWVRDQLATNARRIYLVGALNLTAAKRKYLESINVAPIDLGDLVADYDDHNTKHEMATKIFLQTLEDLKPKQAWEWTPTSLTRSKVTEEEFNKTIKNSTYASAALERQLPILEADRKSYPGWLVCPTSLRWQLQNQINDPFPTEYNISEMPSDSQTKLLYEISWRNGVTYQIIQPWLSQNLFAICDPAKPCILTKKQQMEIALLLLRNTRWLDDSAYKSIEEATTSILQINARYWPECSNELALHQAVLARDNFDFPGLEKSADAISITEPIWGLRKASLLAELGRFDESNKLIAEAYRELLKQHRSDRNSIYVLSRLAWAHWLLRGVEVQNFNKNIEPFPTTYQDSKCNPFDHIEHITQQITKALEAQQKQQGIQPSFEPGSYKNNADTVTLNNELHPILLIDGISNTTGVPLRWDSVNFLVEPASRLTQLDDIEGMHCFALAVRAAKIDTSEVLRKAFSRTKIACLSHNEASQIMDCCLRAINYWSAKLSEEFGASRVNTVDRLRVFIEVLARVSVRANQEQAKCIFNLGVSLGKQSAFQHVWLCDALTHLISYSLKSIPESLHNELLLDALSFPLQIETKLKLHSNWPNPVIKFPGARNKNSTLDRRIDEIIDSIAPCSPKSAPALLRILPLLESKFLTDSERKKVMVQIWGDTPNYKTLPETGLLKYTLLEFPAPDPSAVRCTIRQYLFEAVGDAILESSLLVEIINISKTEKFKELPDEDQALSYFDRLVSWRAKPNDHDFLGIGGQEDKRKGELIAAVLARSIVPSLPTKLLNDENYMRLHTFYSEVGSPEAVMAFAYFSANNFSFSDRVEKTIRQGLQERSANKVAFSSYALLKWRELDESPATRRLTSRLIYLIGSKRMIGLPALLWTANQMYMKNYLSEEDIDSLVELLPIIYDEADYKSISHISQEAVSISLVRAACVSIAKDILINYQGDGSEELLRMMEEARQDTLPEVRFAAIK
jgi:hypothetical protein